MGGINCVGSQFAEQPLIRFLYDGSRINDDDTPASLEMEDNGEPFSSVVYLFVSEITPI